MNDLIKYNLFQCRTIQPFRTSKGKNQWFFYNNNYTNYIKKKPKQDELNLRLVLDNEVVIEFDDNLFEGSFEEFQHLSWEATNFTCINLYKAGYIFGMWDHEGKSPHIHIRNLPISHLPKEELKLFKKVFIKSYVPERYLKYADTSLCGIHLLALEYQKHWKGKYGIKKLIHKFNPQGELT